MKNEDNILNFYRKRLKRIIVPFLLIDGTYWFYSCIILKYDFLEFVKNITFYSFWIKGNKTVCFIAFIIILYTIYPFWYRKILINDKVNKLFCTSIVCIISYAGCYFLKMFYPVYFNWTEIALTRIPVFF